MPALLDRTSLPAWVFIIIIAVGSLCIIITVALIIRCSVIKRRAKRHSTVIDQGPMRRMTVRRGRMVPASNYLSLTGSRFGLNQFDDNETLKSGRKSPFEWFGSTSKKQQDEMSRVEGGRLGSIGDIYSRREFAQSSTSLTSEKEASSTIQEVEPAFPSPTALPPVESTRTQSFSRPFNPRLTSSLMHSRNLSMIEEASPHASVISARSDPRKSGMSIKADGTYSRIEQRKPSSATRSSSTESPPTSSQLSRPPSIPGVPRPIAYAGSRSSLGEVEQTRASTSRRSSSSKNDSATDLTQPRHSNKPPMPAKEPSNEYWSSRTDLRPISRSGSKKGNVLRKKSIKRQEVFASVAT